MEYDIWKNVITFMRIGTANEAAYILLTTFTAIMDAALKSGQRQEWMMAWSV